MSLPYRSYEYVYFMKPEVTKAQIDELERFTGKPCRAVAHIITVVGKLKVEELSRYLPNIPEREVVLALAVLVLYGLVYTYPEFKD